MNGRIQCEFFLIRYVPDSVRNEFVNIGVLLREAGGAEQGPVLRFTRNWARVRCVDPDADTEMLEGLEGELRGRLVEAVGEGMKPVLESIEDSFSNMLQITPPKVCLAESLPAEIESLMRIYVEPLRAKGASKKSGRAVIQAAIRTEFERAGVWALMKKQIAAEKYTRAGDALRIDCGYRPNGFIRMFHSVSLESDTDMAKVLAFSMPALREGVARVEGGELQLTAVVEPIARMGANDDAITQYRFAVETMEAGAIRVMTVSDLPRIAETARRELLGA